MKQTLTPHPQSQLQHQFALDEDVHRKLKAQSVQTGVPMRRIVHNILRKELGLRALASMIAVIALFLLPLQARGADDAVSKPKQPAQGAQGAAVTTPAVTPAPPATAPTVPPLSADDVVPYSKIYLAMVQAQDNLKLAQQTWIQVVQQLQAKYKAPGCFPDPDYKWVQQAQNGGTVPCVPAPPSVK